MDESWEDYHEPLARIFREVKKALPDWRQRVKNNDNFDEDNLLALLMGDPEVQPELENLLQKMIEEIEGKNDSGGM